MDTSTYLLKNLGDPTTKAVKYMLKVWKVPKDIRDKIPCMPSKIYCHPVFSDCFQRCLELVICRGLQDEIQEYNGCYNVRKIRGVSGKWSVHSWGLAIDINASTNKLGQEPEMSSALVDCFTDFFEWGGDFTRQDGMHFQLRQKFI